MKILMVVPFYPRQSHPYAGIFLHTQVKNITKLGGVDIDIVFFKQYVPKFIARLKPKWREIESIPSDYIFDGVSVKTYNVISLPKNTSHWIACIYMRRIIRSIIEKGGHQIVHAHFAYPYGLAAALAGKQCRVPVILTCHGSDINTLPKKAFDAKLGVRLALTTADRVIAVSHALSKAAISIAHRPIDVVYNGVDPSNFTGTERLERIIYVGNLIKTKGVRDLIAAFKKSRATNLVLIGDGEEREFIEDQAKLLPSSKSITLLGKLDNVAVRKEIAMSQILVLPSYSEGLPTVVMEAMMEGVPVIATNVGGTPEIALHNKNAILIMPGEIEELTMAIDELLSDTGLRKRFADKSLRFAQKHLNSRSAAQSILDIYRGVLQ